ncbi:DUF4185 domain-containing protein [Corynebacterium rouxii]|uniref:DUF4185 domain-containing protein n=1 Tax=Corynebacterium rouxii TaxID=2719119 RepID=UPI003CEFB5C6
MSTRSIILKRMKMHALIIGLGLSAIIVPVAHAQSSELSSGSSSLWGLSSSGNDGPVHSSIHISPGLEVTKIGDLFGRGISDSIDVLAGDLGQMAPLNNKGEFAIIFGDSFRGEHLGEGEWLSPIGVVAKLENGRIKIVRPLNEGDRAQQLIDYKHNERNLTLLPSDIINIDGTLYLQAMWNEGVGNVLKTEIWKSTDNGRKWESVATLPKDYMGGMGNLITWEKGVDGYIYMMSSEFKRKDDVYLTRFKPEDMDTPSRWEHYDSGVWGKTYSPVLSKNVQAGEMCLRYIDGYWVLSMFNANNLSIEVRVADSITADWENISPAKVVVMGSGGWSAPQGPNNFTQLYGGYIVPGSSLENMDFVVSQWNTTTNKRYNSTQFNVKGLDQFFGINRSASENIEEALEVTEKGTVEDNHPAPLTMIPLADGVN